MRTILIHSKSQILRAIRWCWSHFLLLVIYGVFLFSSGKYALNKFHYAGVEQWPSVKAKVLGEIGGLISFPHWGKFGGGGTIDTSEVQFEYEVDGNSYQGSKFSPNGGALPPLWQDMPWQAFYNPSSPEYAVLLPVPYEGMGWLACTVGIGMMVSVHLYCAWLDFLERMRKRRRASQGRGRRKRRTPKR